MASLPQSPAQHDDPSTTMMMMMTTAPSPPNFAPAEATKAVNGLTYGISDRELRVLGEKCFEAKRMAYCPYSLFRVGASLLLRPDLPMPAAGTATYPHSHIVTGANVENAAYPVGVCAERVAMGTAVMAGHRIGSFRAVGVASDIVDFCSPCGMCRQFLREFLLLDTPIFLFNREGNWIVRTMEELLPLSFGPDVLPPREQMRKLSDAI